MKKKTEHLKVASIYVFSLYEKKVTLDRVKIKISINIVAHGIADVWVKGVIKPSQKRG